MYRRIVLLLGSFLMLLVLTAAVPKELYNDRCLSPPEDVVFGMEMPDGNQLVIHMKKGFFSKPEYRSQWMTESEYQRQLKEYRYNHRMERLDGA